MNLSSPPPPLSLSLFHYYTHVPWRNLKHHSLIALHPYSPLTRSCIVDHLSAQVTSACPQCKIVLWTSNLQPNRQIDTAVQLIGQLRSVLAASSPLRSNKSTQENAGKTNSTILLPAFLLSPLPFYIFTMEPPSWNSAGGVSIV